MRLQPYHPTFDETLRFLSYGSAVGNRMLFIELEASHGLYRFPPYPVLPACHHFLFAYAIVNGRLVVELRYTQPGRSVSARYADRGQEAPYDTFAMVTRHTRLCSCAPCQ